VSRRSLALALIAGGLAVLVAATGHILWDGRQTARAQEQLRAEVPDASSPRVRGVGDPTLVPVATPAKDGEALAALTIPRFGPEWSWVVVEGTSDEALEQGPGHYRTTPLPGELGNVAIAGHRAGHGDPFLSFDLLRPGDHLLLSQGDTTWDYVIDGAPQIVPATADWVLDPLAGRRLTLTTCWPRYGSSKRMFVRATLVR
jgi:sortase A